MTLLAGKKQSKEYVAAVLAEVRKLLENDEEALAAFEKHRSDRMEVASWSSSSSSSSSGVSAPAQHIVKHYTTTQSSHVQGMRACLCRADTAGRQESAGVQGITWRRSWRRCASCWRTTKRPSPRSRSTAATAWKWWSSSSSSSSRVSAPAQHIVKHYTTTQSPPRAGQKRGAYDAMTLLAGKKQKVSKEREAAILAEVRKLENDEEALAAFEKHRSDRMEGAAWSSSSPSSS